MKIVTDFQAQILWQGQISQAKKIESSWPLKVLIAPLILGFLFLLSNDFSREAISQGLIAFGAIFTNAAIVSLAIALLGKNSRRMKPLTAVLFTQSNTAIAFTTSIICLRLAVDALSEISYLHPQMEIFVLVFFLLTTGFAVAISPSSIPANQEQVDEGRSRMKWLPYIMGIQGAAISIGTLLSAWILQGTGLLGFLLLSILMTITASLLIFVSILGLWRFLMMVYTKDSVSI